MYIVTALGPGGVSSTGYACRSAWAGYPLQEADILGVSHIQIHHESQEWGLAPLQVIHTTTIGDVSIAAKRSSA